MLTSKDLARIANHGFAGLEPGNWDDLLALARRAQEMGWISVKDRLPDNNVYVLTIDSEGAQTVDCWFPDALYMEDVTHWMPIPAAPDAERK